MSDWIKTKAGLQMAETITRSLPKMLVAFEEIAIGLNYLRRMENDHRRDSSKYNEEKDVAFGASIVKSNKEVEGVFMSNGEVVSVDYVKEEK